MANFCIPKFQTQAFRQKLKDGTINPQELADMTSAERREFLGGIIGEDLAPKVNAEFEGKLLLVNQQQGILNWAKKTAGLSEAAKRDILDKVARMKEVLQPQELKNFYEDLAAQRLGTHVTPEEASRVVELSKKVEDAKTAMQEGGDRMEYGRARVEFSNYISELKNEAKSKTLAEMAAAPIETTKNALAAAPGFTKSLKASLDNSAIFRQGWKTMLTHPVEWQKNAIQSFRDIADSLGGKEVLDEVNADIISRPTYDLMKQAKLAIGTTEEAYPSHLAEKVPGLGKLYKASESAYTGFVYRQRADIFDKYLKIAETAGVDVTDKIQLESIGNLVNSLTGRGNLGARGERVGDTVNNIFFSPRFLKSNIDTLTAHQFQKGVTPFVRKQAAQNLARIVIGTAIILGMADAIAPGSVDFDPRSSNFGKIKVGHTTFDVSGGMASLLTLAARILTFSSKSGTTGKITKLNSGKFGSQTVADVIYNFGEGKLSPVASIFKDVAKGQDFSGNKPTVSGEAQNLLVPLPITNYQELKNDPKSAGVLAGMLADSLGISTNTYTPKKK